MSFREFKDGGPEGLLCCDSCDDWSLTAGPDVRPPGWTDEEGSERTFCPPCSEAGELPPEHELAAERRERRASRFEDRFGRIEGVDR